jgi:hypothetical protein
MKNNKINISLRQSNGFLSSNDFGYLSTTVSPTSQGTNKYSNLTDVKTVTSDSDNISFTNHPQLKPTNTFTKDPNNKKVSIMTNLFIPEPKNNRLIDKYNEIFDKKKMVFAGNRQKSKKRIYRTKDGTCYNLLDELKAKQGKIICDRTEYEVGQIKTKVNFMKCVCDYSYPRIVSKQITMFKKLKNKQKSSSKVHNFSFLKTDETVSADNINKTSSYFYKLQTNPMNSEYFNFPIIGRRINNNILV